MPISYAILLRQIQTRIRGLKDLLITVFPKNLL